MPMDAAKRLERYVAHVVSVNQNAAAGRVIKAGEKRTKRRFAAAGRTNKRHGLTCLNMEVDVLQNFFLIVIAERNVAVFDVSLDGVQAFSHRACP